MWDDECEAKAWELMGGFVSSSDKPTLEVQQETANWLNQMMPYPGWRFKEAVTGRYWLVVNGTLGIIVGGVSEDNEYTHTASQKKSYRLLELITQLEMGL